MEWNNWIGKEVFIKMEDGTVFSHSKVLNYENPFISITDLFGSPVVININKIIRIREEKNGKSINR